ncbi:MAG: type I DNA topoisomerase [Clostridia bacterium]|nr:type I DNA topoisomerase [Clostridia bacterium]
MKLVIVESPAKAKTIGKYLGSDYKVDASGGHIRDLPVKELGIDIDNNYEPKYVDTVTKKDLIKRLAAEVKKADGVYLATDPDREGEAISWHLANALKLKTTDCNRIEFNEITKNAVQNALSKPRKIDMDLVNAQQARRVLDRLVGYKLSPVLCKKIRKNLSAGRVQSAALKILVDREREIRAFKPEEYWVITAYLYKKDSDCGIFKSLLFEKSGKKIKVENKEQCDKVLSDIENGKFIVQSVKRGTKASYPQPPFTTSTLQQDAISKLNLGSSVTMQIAQQLYEGVELPGLGHTALVTYIRTDSVRVAKEAQDAALAYIGEKYGDKYVPQKPNVYKSKKDSQDAHEAIRPINLAFTPQSLAKSLKPEQYKVYKLIYERFLASQSTPAQYNTLAIVFDCNNYGFKTTGRTMLFDGYLRIYGEDKAENGKAEDEEDKLLPDFSEKEQAEKDKITNEQKFTKPPTRYTESSLVKAMEESGIGRPSTYSTIINTLYFRKYSELDKKSIVPTELGFIVTEYLEKYFADVVNIEFTAGMEDKLDNIEEKGDDWRKVVHEFYQPLLKEIVYANKEGEKVKMKAEESDVICEKCGAKMIIKEGPYGKYLACPNFPDCKNIKGLKNGEKTTESKPTDIKCEKCGADMVEKTGRYGRYLACSKYPECKNTKPINEIVGKCPKCGGDLVKRFSKAGKLFYGCSKYPDCKFMSWDIPSDKPCEKCGGTMYKKTGKQGNVFICENCKNTREVNE